MLYFASYTSSTSKGWVRIMRRGEGTGGPSLIYEGKDALLTCVVSENRSNNTVIWKKLDEILTAGKVRVTSDLRISVLHDESPKGRIETGGEVWVLLIKKLKPSDSGSYICELNSEPVLRSIHILTVKPLPSKHNNNNNSTYSDSSSNRDSAASESSDVFLVPPPLDANDNRSFWRTGSVAPQITHDFTECCERANVSQGCMGFCNVHNILDGTTGIEPEACEKDFPQIVRCMADGRNHVPCCVEKQIPDLCQDMCRGEYTPFTDMLRTRVSCVHHTLSGLQCILQGVQQIPSSPLNVAADEVSETRVIISWSPPEKLAHLVKHYNVNLTALHSFDEDEGDEGADDDDGDAGTIRKEDENVIIRLVSGNDTSITINDLKPLTMYAILVTAVNDYGSSLPSERLRIFTHTSALATEEKSGPSNKMDVPDLPDIRSCCETNGMTHRMCLDKMCDPQKTDLATLPDFMVCAPWSNITFNCLANNIDHTPCCRARGIPTVCYPLCSGKVSTLDFNLFKCLRFMSEFSSCLFQGYGVLADPPSKLHTVAKTDSFVILDWNKPKRLADTISTFHVKFRRLGVGDDYLTVEKVNLKLYLPIGVPELTVDSKHVDVVNTSSNFNIMTFVTSELITNETSIDLINLEPHALYRIMVLTRGKFGTSLPSSMLLINTTEINNSSSSNSDGNTEKVDQQQSKHIYGAPSPPHSLAIIAHSATWMQLTWQPPEYSHPHEKITYRVYHKPMKSDKFNKIETKVAWLRMNNLKPSSQHILYVEAVGEKATSLPSETLVAWTDPALPAFVDPPTVHPADNIPEGGSMTILCLALGNPAPTISLYVGGHLVRQDTSRHMVTVIHNVTADMEHVSCYADNGYGVPMQATRRVNICYPPKIQAAGITVAAVGDEVELRCMVDSKPAPKTIFWRDHDGRIPVIQGGNYDIAMRTNESRPTFYTMALRINKLQASDVGDYFCHAENPFGSATIPVSVRIRNTPALNHNVTQCCADMNVTMACRSACSYYVDIDAIADKPECITEFDKLMKCAADGSDHRTCCADSHVPRKCLNWCRGEAVRSKEICSLQYARTIVGCFESYRDRLPGPPENIAVSVISDSEVVIRWDPPTKNPNVVDGYRIFYHEAAIIGNEIAQSETMTGGALAAGGPLEVSSTAPSNIMLNNNNNATSMQMAGNNNTTTSISSSEVRRIDVKETSVNIDGLKKDVLYELVVKAGNSYGASVLTEPIKFTLGEHHVTSATTTYSHAVGTISGIVASILAVLLAAAAIIFYRRHRANGKAATGVAFENPTYTRGLEQVQLPTVTSALTHTTNMNGGNFTTRTPASTHATTTVSSAALPAATTLRPSMTSKVGNNSTMTTASAAAAQYQPKGTTVKTSNLDGIDAHTQCNEINPTIYEELKLGQEGAGFKKLVP
ncbi:Ig-like and fibronectin type-III domain-containing protein 1 [Lucilia cuprina]|uniref:Ig-like and fibronectin type-III domain-containing protein 1 n=1 Tax=Lucilia cuprina TaxID=7375 RepID=UPI001F0608E0|nr:Ig-like and fibronectin type-III domain-containing protein 1 [Lucilia cuprina]